MFGWFGLGLGLGLHQRLLGLLLGALLFFRLLFLRTLLLVIRKQWVLHYFRLRLLQTILELLYHILQFINRPFIKIIRILLVAEHELLELLRIVILLNDLLV